MNTPSTPNPTRRALRVLGVTFLIYGALVATHEGEFWPFSIFPMFSQAGNPWSRAVVRDVPPTDAERWDAVGAADLPGAGYPLLDYGVDPIDLANFVKKTEHWTPRRVAALGTMLEPPRGRTLRVYRADGRMAEGDSVAVTFVPVATVSADTVLLNPVLPR